ncbi:MAG: hypothetical protein GTN82_35255 [Candidatus Aminicenantes bacterium]|nr:hypothetical protein [Candidatus Aminicenantes bacterium]
MKPEDIDPEEREEFVIMLTAPLLIEDKIMTLEEAVNYYEEKVSQEPENPSYIIGLAHIFDLSKRAEDAVPLMETALRLEPQAMDPYLWLGDWYYHKKDSQKAFNYYQDLYQLIESGEGIHYILDGSPEKFVESFFEGFIGLAKHLKKPLPPDLNKWLKESEV